MPYGRAHSVRQSIRWLAGGSLSESYEILEETVSRITAYAIMDYFEDEERKGSTG